MEPTLSQRFPKYIPDEKSRRIMNDGTVCATRVSIETKTVEVDVRFPYLVGKKAALYPLERSIKRAYALNSVTIVPKYPPKLFDGDYVPEILTEACRRQIISEMFLSRGKAALSGEVLTLETMYGDGGAALLSGSGIEKKLEDLIFDEFGRKINVRIAVSGERDEQYEARMQADINEKLDKYYEETAKRAENEKKSPSATGVCSEMLIDENKIMHAGNYAFDISDPTLLSDKPFDIAKSLPLGQCAAPVCNVVITGEVCCYKLSETRRGSKTVTFVLTDGEGAVSVKCRGRNVGDYISLTNEMCISLKGSFDFDDFDGELTFYPTAAMQVKPVLRLDCHEGKKRVELHLHTNMSAMDALTTPTQAVETAYRFGHSAVAITDHGCVQGFPEAMKASEKLGMKIIYGMEGYLVDDAARAIYGDDDTRFDGEFVVFDIETTGLSAISCAITEIGAVLVGGGKVKKIFSTFVNPGVHIPADITKLTGITDEMVKDAPSPSEAVGSFIGFVGERAVVAHNANFDMSFIRRACEDAGLKFDPAYLDTVSMSRFLNPELKNHKLDTLADFYGYGDFNHHRACDDAEVTAKIFFKMTEKLAGEGIFTVAQMSEAMTERTDPLKLRTHHIILLVKNPTGLKNLYKIVSAGYLKYFKKHPRIPKTLLSELREGLIVGSACQEGELYSAILDGKTDDDVRAIASFYDYLEIQPLCNNEFLIDEKGLTRENLIDINKRIVKLGDELKKPVVATCDSHYTDDCDGICRNILLYGLGFSDYARDSHLYFRTTDEMLDEFSYLGKAKAEEVVIDNTNRIADQIGTDIRPFPKGQYTPKMEGAEEELQNICYTTAKSIYGDPLPETVSARLEKELKSIISHGFAVLYMIARKLVKFSESQGYLVGSRGSVGSSFVASMAGISEVNPLPPHYVCPKCRHSDFSNEEKAGSGFDLPPKNCPVCGTLYKSDGHDIPFETFLGFYGDKTPDIDLNFSGDVQGRVHKYTEELFGKKNVFRAGTVGTLADKTAFGFVSWFFDENGKKVNRATVNRLVSKLVGIKRTTGQHPGGIVVVPKEYEIYDFCPVQHPADDASSDIITTHFTFNDMHDLLLKLDELGHDIPTKYKYLEMYTNTNVLDVPVTDPEVYKLFNSTEPLGVKPEDIGGVKVGTLGIPENGTDFVIPVLLEAKPKNFADLLQIMGVTHGTDVWAGNAQTLIKNGTCDLSTIVGTRDSIMLTLINKYGLDNKDAFDIMELVRKNKKGVPLPDWMVDRMHEHSVDEWYIDSLRKIKYMFPKAHAAAYVLSAIRMAWYKIHMPLGFYCAYFSAAPDGFDGDLAMKGKKAIYQILLELREKGSDQSQKEASTYSAMQLAGEYLARGFKFLPVDLYKSDPKLFVPEDGAIRLPFSSLPGVGVAAAQNIADSRENGEFLSVEELKQRTSVSKSVIETFEKNGVLDKLSETNQITFGFEEDKNKRLQQVKTSVPKSKKEADNIKTEQEPEEITSESSQLSFF